ncbi:MAG: hypothetical protein GX785_05655 [Armatimonadetes bacterium]|nr:hypothetical protein [Armatimonadota bacterium]
MARFILRATFLVAALWLPALVAAAPAAPHVNLLANPSFEEAAKDDPTRAAGWASYQCGYTRTRDRSYAPEINGPWSVRIAGTGKDDEKGFGGLNTHVTTDLPAHGKFVAYNSIYIDSYTQGAIYGAYITATYTDGTQKTFSFLLSDEQIRSNLKRWKTYRLVFSTDPEKKLRDLTHWCLVWRKGETKFIGTVYFDDLELRLLPEGEAMGASVPFTAVNRTATPPVLDGRADDACWKESPWLGPFVLASGLELASQQTTARATYDDRHLYLFLECAESVLDPAVQKREAFKAQYTEHDSAVYKDDAVELFLMPPGGEAYYHLAINSLGTVYDARCRSDSAVDPGWNSGAVAKGQVGERAWSLEVAIPWQAMGARAPQAGEAWRINICRAEQANKENSCWSPTGGAFHTPASFGVASFGASPVAVDVIDLGRRGKGTNELRLSLTNPSAQPVAVTVNAFIDGTGRPVEAGRQVVRLGPGATERVKVEYVSPGGGGVLRYEVAEAGRVLYTSAGFPLRFDTVFMARVTVLGANHTRPITEFHVVQGEWLALPLVVTPSVSPEAFREAQAILEVPRFLRLVNPLAGARRAPAPLRVTEARIERDGKPYRRYTLELGAAHVTFPEAAAQREFVLNPLLFCADLTGSRPEEVATYPLGFDIRVNGQSSVAGEVPITLLPPLPRRSPSNLVVCNWPCGMAFQVPFFYRLSELEQRTIAESWLRAGFNFSMHTGILREVGKGHPIKSGYMLPGNLNDISASLPGIAEYLAAHPQYRTVCLNGKVLDRVVSPAHLLEPDCPLRPLVRELAGKLAKQYPVLSWDYEVPVLLPQSIGFDAANLAAFRRFAKIPEAAPLTPEIVARDYRELWVDFRCRQNAEIAGLLQEGIKQANPECLFFVYSGYQGPNTRQTYGVNWEYMRPHIDQGWCGYGRPVSLIQETRRALADRPLVGGELAWFGDGTPYNQDEAEPHLFRRLTDSAGGFMVYYDWFLDGRFTRAIARAAAVAADFEAFFLQGKRDDSLAAVDAGDAANVAVYALGDERLLFLFNHTAKPQPFRITMAGLAPGVAGIDYWTRKPVSLRPALETTVPAYTVQVIYACRQNTGAVPTTPRLLEPSGEIVTDYRPLLRWEHEGSARCTYTIELSREKDFPAASTRRIEGVPGTSWVVSEALDETARVYWRVRAVDALTGKASIYSPAGEFTLGTLGVEVAPAVFSPNGDGKYDTASLRAELRSEAPWKVAVASASGQVVREIAGQGDHVEITWDGKDAGGKVVPDGRYLLRLVVKGRDVASERVEVNSRFGVPNPRLEQWCEWQAVALEGGETLQDYLVAPEGLPYSLKLTGRDTEAKAYWSNYRTGTEIPITPGKEYVFTGLVKGDLAPDGVAEIRLHFFTKENRWAPIPGLSAEWDGVTAELKGKKEWTRLTVSCRAPENAAKAVLFFRLTGKGSAWFGAAEFGEKK